MTGKISLALLVLTLSSTMTFAEDHFKKRAEFPAANIENSSQKLELQSAEPDSMPLKMGTLLGISLMNIVTAEGYEAILFFHRKVTADVQTPEQPMKDSQHAGFFAQKQIDLISHLSSKGNLNLAFQRGSAATIK